MASQPDLNFRNPHVVAEMRNILAFWLGKGVAGFRVDAINHLFEDMRFLDEPRNAADTDPNSYDCLQHIYTADVVRNISRHFFFFFLSLAYFDTVVGIWHKEHCNVCSNNNEK